jgi:putative Holliday junction resolvase
LEWGVKQLVVGIPKDDEETTRRIKHFVSLLDFDGEKNFVDEDISSMEAKEDLRKSNIKQTRDGRIDSLAAKVILERFLNEKS